MLVFDIYIHSFRFVKKVNKVDYQLTMLRKMKIFHMKLLKKYIERKRAEVSPILSDKSVFCFVGATVVDCVENESQEGQLVKYPKISSELIDSNPCLS